MNIFDKILNKPEKEEKKKKSNITEIDEKLKKIIKESVIYDDSIKPKW